VSGWQFRTYADIKTEELQFEAQNLLDENNVSEIKMRRRGLRLEDVIAFSKCPA
jgi:hypothetical protein